MAADDGRTTIAVFGQDDGLVDVVLNEILGQTKTSAPDSAPTASYPGFGSAFSHTLETKYYTAAVTVATCASLSLPSSEEETDALGELAEALVLVYHKASDEAQGLVEAWAQFIEDYAPAILLTVGVRKDESEDIVYDASAWSLDNGVEEVEVVLEQAAVGGGLDDGEPDDWRDCDGLSRVTQALEAHMWPGLVMVDQERQAAQPLGGEERVEKVGGLTMAEIDRIAARAVGAVTVGNLDAEEAAGETPEEIEAAFADFAGGLDGMGGAGAGGGLGGDEDFAAAFDEIRRIREQGANLPPDERRDLAAAMAMALFEQLDAAGDGGGGGGGGGGDA